MVGIFSNWNQPTSIIAPDNSVPFQTLISSMMPSTIAPTPTKPKTTIKTTK